MKMKIRVLAAAALIAAATLAQAQTARIANQGDSLSMDPHSLNESLQLSVTGNVYEVHIDMLVPGDELVVSKAPHKAKERYSNPDIRTSVREAFQAAERQLVDYKEQLRGDVKLHEPLFQGQVSEIDPKGEFGFVLTKEGNQLYFHRNSVMEGDWGKLRRGATVHYVEATGDTGPTASKVWVGSEHHES